MAATPKNQTNKRPSSEWTVKRLGAKSQSQREAEEEQPPKQKKPEVEELTIRTDGVEGDYNHYRTTVLANNESLDRAVSISTVAAYDLLRNELGGVVRDGDLGENILLEGPPALSTKSFLGYTAAERDEDGLHVGARLKIGNSGVVLEITAPSDPCYQFETQRWAKTAKEKWGPGWYKRSQCPLNHTKFPGVRGWLARVLEEGTVRKGNTVELLEDENNNSARKNPKRACRRG